MLRQQRCSGVGQLILDIPLSNSRSYIGCLYIGLPMQSPEGNSERWNETAEVRRCSHPSSRSWLGLASGRAQRVASWSPCPIRLPPLGC